MRVSRANDGAPIAAEMRNFVSTATFKKGALLVTTGTGEVDECGTNPATVMGIAAEAAFQRPGYNAANAPSPVTGIIRWLPVWLTRADYTFFGRMVNGGTDPYVPVLADIGVSYGVTKDAAGIWYIDKTKTGANLVVVITGIDTLENRVFFRFLAGVQGY